MGWARFWSLDLSPGLPGAKSQAGSGPRLGVGSPGLGTRLQGPGPAQVSALLPIYVCAYPTLTYVMLRDFCISRLHYCTLVYVMLRYFMSSPCHFYVISHSFDEIVSAIVSPTKIDRQTKTGESISNTYLGL